MSRYLVLLPAIALIFLGGCESPPRLGEQTSTSALVSTGQLVRPVGDVRVTDARPVDMRLIEGGAKIALKDNRGILIVDRDMKSTDRGIRVNINGGTSLTGMAVAPDGTIWVSSAKLDLVPIRKGRGQIRSRQSNHLARCSG